MSAPVLLALRLLLAIVLYAFLGWALYTLWKNVQKSGTNASNDNIPIISLSVGNLDNSSQTYQFSQAQIIIGRDPVSDLSIDDNNISARHALLTYQLGQWWVEDLKSTNGTSLNNDSVTEPFVITDGDEIRCGQILFIVNFL